MGSTRLRGAARFGAVVLVLVVMGGCTSSGRTPRVTGQPLSAATLAATPAHVAVPGASGTIGSGAADQGVARATAAPVTVDQITADYTYKNVLITPIAHLYGDFLDDFVILTVENGNTAPVKVVATSQINGYTSAATDTVTIAAGATEEIRQNPALTPTAIDGLSSEHQAELHVVLSYLDAGQARTVLDQTSTTMVSSRRDFPWAIDGFSQAEDFDLIAAMVTPTDPGVEDLIRKAANYDPSGAMTSGYDAEEDNNGTVLQRLSDVWQAETADYSLTYISTTISFAPGSSQRIRLPEEVLSEASGNCIELTLLYASVAEALGMQPAIIIVPGHAYVGIRVDDTNDSYYFVETTMIGQASFSDAATTGLSEWTEAQPHVLAAEQDYGWVDVRAQRANGVTPIPWH